VYLVENRLGGFTEIRVGQVPHYVGLSLGQINLGGLHVYHAGGDIPLAERVSEINHANILRPGFVTDFVYLFLINGTVALLYPLTHRFLGKNVASVNYAILAACRKGRQKFARNVAFLIRG